MDRRLFDRERELRDVDEGLRAASAGRGGLLIVEGPPGIGKTELFRAAGRRAEELGIQPLRAHGGELEASFPFGVVRQLFEPPLVATPEDERSRLLAGAAGLSRPLLGMDEAGGWVGGELEFDVASYPQLHGLYWLAANLSARGPLLISVDDAQWADAPSLRWLHYLATRVGELPALVLVGTRPVDVEAGSGVPGLLSAIVSAPEARLLHPRPLATDHVAALVRERLGPSVSDRFAEACAVATRGNPFYLHELLADLERSGVAPTDGSASQVSNVSTRTIQTHVGHRLASLGAGSVALARAIAILGTSAEPRHVAALIGIEEAECATSAAALMDAGILERGFPLRFVHPIVRTAVYEQVPAGMLVEDHRRAARILAEDGATPEEVAMHLLAAGRCTDGWEVDTLRTAARRARARGTPKAAVRYLCEALKAARGADIRAAVVAELGAAQLRAGDPAATATLEQAVREAPTPAARADVALLLGRALTTSGQFQKAVALLEGLLDAEEERAPDTVLRLRAELIAPGRLNAETLPTAKRLLAGAAARLTAGGATDPLMLAHLAYDAVTCGEPSERALDLARRALARGALLAEAGIESPTYYTGAWTLALCDRCEEAELALSTAIDAATRAGSVLGFALATTFRTSVRHRAGALADAEADARSVLDVENHHWHDLAHGFLLAVLVDQGRVEDGFALIARIDMEGEVPNTMLHQPLLYARGELRLAAGHLDQGVGDLRLAGERAAEGLNRTPAFHPYRSSLALALARRGEEKEAKALAAEELELARRFGAPRALGVALRGVGLLAGGEDGIRLLEESVAVLRASEAALERARSIVELGAATRREGRRRAACVLLREGLELAHRCGAQPLAKRARDELAAAGSRPRRPVRTGVDALTASERRVAQLAASGMTNRDIAQSLFVTLKTVEWHLGQAYGKLGITGRQELSGVLGPAAAPADERAALSATAG